MKNNTIEKENQQAETGLPVASIIFVIVGVVSILCMFLNWFPVDLDLGYVQFRDVFGKINALALPGVLNDLEDSLGMFSSFLPKQFDTLKNFSIGVMALNVAAILLYVWAIYLHATKKEKHVNLASALASVVSLLTTLSFIKLISEVYSGLGLSANAEMSAVMTAVLSPCGVVIVCGVASFICCAGSIELPEVLEREITEVNVCGTMMPIEEVRTLMKQIDAEEATKLMKEKGVPYGEAEFMLVLEKRNAEAKLSEAR